MDWAAADNSVALRAIGGMSTGTDIVLLVAVCQKDISPGRRNTTASLLLPVSARSEAERIAEAKPTINRRLSRADFLMDFFMYKIIPQKRKGCMIFSIMIICEIR